MKTKIQLDDTNFIYISIEKDYQYDLKISASKFDLSWNEELLKKFNKKLYSFLLEYQEEEFINVFLESSFLSVVPLKMRVVPLSFLLEYTRNNSMLQENIFNFQVNDDKISVALEGQELFIQINNSYDADPSRGAAKSYLLLKKINQAVSNILKNSCLEFIIVEPLNDKHAERIDDFALAGNYDRRFLVFVDDLLDVLLY